LQVARAISGNADPASRRPPLYAGQLGRIVTRSGKFKIFIPNGVAFPPWFPAFPPGGMCSTASRMNKNELPQTAEVAAP